jgi:hypothetical protein
VSDGGDGDDALRRASLVPLNKKMAAAATLCSMRERKRKRERE